MRTGRNSGERLLHSNRCFSHKVGSHLEPKSVPEWCQGDPPCSCPVMPVVYSGWLVPVHTPCRMSFAKHPLPIVGSALWHNKISRTHPLLELMILASLCLLLDRHNWAEEQRLSPGDLRAVLIKGYRHGPGPSQFLNLLLRQGRRQSFNLGSVDNVHNTTPFQSPLHTVPK